MIGGREGFAKKKRSWCWGRGGKTHLLEERRVEKKMENAVEGKNPGRGGKDAIRGKDLISVKKKKRGGKREGVYKLEI